MKKISKLYLKCLVIALPFVLIIASYVLIDPFGILFKQSPIQPEYKNIITDHRRTNELLDGYQSEGFNTFAFGNSQVQAFHDVYPEYVEDASFHDFHNPGESIWNIYKKIKLIDSLGLSLDHVLISLNGPLIENVKNTNPFYIGTKYHHHPLTSGSSQMDYHLEAFGFYLADLYFIKYLDYNLFKEHRPYMEGVIPKGKAKYLQDAVIKEQAVKKQNMDYYKGKKEKIDPAALDPFDLDLLNQIQEFFVKHGTDYVVIFPPNTAIEKINAKTINKVIEVFGQESVFDYSGKNQVVFSKKDFADNIHFKPYVARRILDSIKASDKDL